MTIIKCRKWFGEGWLDIDIDDLDWNTINDIIVKEKHHFVREQWIPCSERLPSKQIEVIVSCNDNSGDTPFNYTACGYWDGLLPDDDPAWIVDGEVNYHVIAWMPLPKPYKENKHE